MWISWLLAECEATEESFLCLKTRFAEAWCLSQQATVETCVVLSLQRLTLRGLCPATLRTQASPRELGEAQIALNKGLCQGFQKVKDKQNGLHSGHWI